MAVRKLQVEPQRPPEGEGRNILRAADYDQTVLDKLRAAIGGGLKDILAAIPSGDLKPDEVVIDYVTDYAGAFVPNIDRAIIQKLTYGGLRLYLSLAGREGFSWGKQLQSAQDTIDSVNKANDGLNLQANYELPDLINALAKQNNPEQLMANLELMQDPRLVVAPAGLAFNHLILPLTVNGHEPNICINLAPATSRDKTAIHLIDAGDLADINTQPEAVKQVANGNDNGLTDQKLREIALNSGMKLDEHGYGMLAAMLRQQDLQTTPDINNYSVFTNELANFPDQVAFSRFTLNRYIFNALYGGAVFSGARIRPSVMAEL